MASRHSSLILVPPAWIGAPALLASFGVGLLVTEQPLAGLGLLVAVFYVPLVFLNLPLGLALWAPLLSLKYLPHFATAGHAAVLLLGLAWLATVHSRRVTATSVIRRHRRLLAMIALLLVWLSLSLLWAQRPGLGTDPLGRWFTAAFVFLVLTTAASSRRDVRLVAGGFIVGATASVLVGLANGGLHPSASAIDTATSQGGRLQGGAGDPNELAQGLVPAIVLGLALMATVRNPVLRLMLLVATAFSAIGLAATQSRGGVVAVLAAIAASLLFGKGERRQVVGFVAVVGAVAAVWFVAYPSAWHRMTSFGDEGTGRAELWQVGWHMTKDHPLVGVGLNNFRVHEPDYVHRPGTLRFVRLIADRPHVPHNVYLQVLVETGVVGLALFLAVLAGALRAAWLAAARFDAAGDRAFAGLARGVLVGSISFLAASFFLTDGFDSRLWLLLGLGPALLGIARRTPRPAPEP